MKPVLGDLAPIKLFLRLSLFASPRQQVVESISKDTSRYSEDSNGKDGIAADVVASSRNRVKITDSLVTNSGEFGIIARAIKAKTVGVVGTGTAPAILMVASYDGKPGFG